MSFAVAAAAAVTLAFDSRKGRSRRAKWSIADEVAAAAAQPVSLSPSLYVCVAVALRLPSSPWLGTSASVRGGGESERQVATKERMAGERERDARRCQGRRSENARATDRERETQSSSEEASESDRQKAVIERIITSNQQNWPFASPAPVLLSLLFSVLAPLTATTATHALHVIHSCTASSLLSLKLNSLAIPFVLLFG